MTFADIAMCILGGGERPVSTIYRAGVEEAVWDASAWESFYAKLRGL